MGDMDNGYIAKYDWFVLKPLALGADLIGIIFLFLRNWFNGCVLLISGFLIGYVAASMHKNISTAQLASGHPRLKDALKKETELLNNDDSFRMGKTTITLMPILGLTFLILLIHSGAKWYLTILFSILLGWLVPIFFIVLMMGLIWVLRSQPDKK